MLLEFLSRSFLIEILNAVEIFSLHVVCERLLWCTSSFYSNLVQNTPPPKKKIKSGEDLGSEETQKLQYEKVAELEGDFKTEEP